MSFGAFHYIWEQWYYEYGPKNNRPDEVSSPNINKNSRNATKEGILSLFPHLKNMYMNLKESNTRSDDISYASIYTLFLDMDSDKPEGQEKALLYIKRILSPENL